MSKEDSIKVVWRKMNDIEEGSSRGKKQKKQEDKEAVEAEFSLVVELWRRVERRWEELEWQQDQRWAMMSAVVGRIAEDVWELLDELVPEEKEKEKETEEMEAEEVEETEKDKEGDMEAEETLKEMEKLADEVERVERDVMEE